MNATASKPLRLAVIGAGVMGKRHIAAAKRIGAPIVAMVDADAAQAKAGAEMAGCPAFADSASLIGNADAAVIAVPTGAHVPIAAPLLKAGIGCLVEKPLAATEAECRQLIAAATEGRAVLQVGHIERFNPAIETLAHAGLPPASMLAIAARRMSASSARVLDIDVVMDLMVHDIDVVLTLKKTPVARVSARGSDDHAVALIGFADGTTATLTASRVTATRIRDLDVVTPDAFFHVDYAARTASKSRRRDSGQFEVSDLAVTGTDALNAQLEGFLASVRGDKAPRVSGEDALATMILTAQIRAALKA
ncbi:MAG: Gfo/Idh/MocA family oxidoreductase [Rhodospirillaceae bacterium]|nr:Gfo/Idh/MocA family oxidoreductase [Rhodospirillaceae bacterium]